MTTYEVKRALTHADNRDLIAAGLKAAEDAMHNVINSDVEVLRDASKHILSAGGKRVRPRLLMLAYLACGGTDVDYAAPPAAAVELMHTASVVHDDINDHGIVRRGRPSVNAKWGRTFALLTGDFLFTAVYSLLAPYKDLNVVLAQAATALVEGETLQAWAVKNNQFTSEIYMDIIARKTAALFEASGEMGAKLANANRKQIDALRQYGYNIGLAFQIVDDILDIVGDETTLGKTAGIDLQQGRGFAAVQANGQANGQTANTHGEDVMNNIKRKLLSGDRLEQARQQALLFQQLAITALEALPDTEAKDELITLAELIVNRNY